MEKKILVPIDYSRVSSDVIKIADEWACKTGADLHFIHVSRPEDLRYYPIDYSQIDVIKEDGVVKDKWTHDLDKFLESKEIKANYHVIHHLGMPSHEIIRVHQEIHADLIIMGAHSHTFIGRLFLGSCTDYVLHHSTCPVYVCKDSEKTFNPKIIVPLDYSLVNQEVVQLADKWAQSRAAELVFIHVGTLPEYSGNAYLMEAGFYHEGDEKVFNEMDQHERAGEKERLQEQMDLYIKGQNIKSEYQAFLEFGKPYNHILMLQERLNAGLIMMAAHSHTLMSRMIMGSNTDYLVHHAACPMYIFRTPDE